MTSSARVLGDDVGCQSKISFLEKSYLARLLDIKVVMIDKYCEL